MSQKVTKFGINQLGNPTPVWAKRVFRLSTLIVLLVAFTVDTFNFTEEVSYLVKDIGIYVPGVIMIITRFFGWDYK